MGYLASTSATPLVKVCSVALSLPESARREKGRGPNEAFAVTILTTHLRDCPHLTSGEEKLFVTPPATLVPGSSWP
jgi:hypothetical protein